MRTETELFCALVKSVRDCSAQVRVIDNLMNVNKDNLQVLENALTKADLLLAELREVKFGRLYDNG